MIMFVNESLQTHLYVLLKIILFLNMTKNYLQFYLIFSGPNVKSGTLKQKYKSGKF